MFGGAFGAGARYGVGVWAVRALGAGGGPWGTLAVNVVGGVLMGALAGAAATGTVGEPGRLALGAGLLGGFTTFSAFSLDVVLLFERGEWGAGLGYAVVSTVGAIGACAVGLAAARSVA